MSDIYNYKKKDLLDTYGESKKGKFRVVHEFTLLEKTNIVVIECDEKPTVGDIKSADLDEYEKKNKALFEKDKLSIITYIEKEPYQHVLKLPYFTKKSVKSPFELFKELNKIK
jgi:hypothetical protein